MENKQICKLLALAMAVVLALSVVALAEDEVVEAEMVELPIAEAAEASLEEVIEEPTEKSTIEQPTEQFVEEQIVERSTEEPIREQIIEESAEEFVIEQPFEECVEEIVNQPADAIIEQSVKQPTELIEAPPATETEIAMVEANEAQWAANSSALISVAIDQSQGNVFYLGMGPVQMNAVLQPAEAQAKIKWKSSKKKVAKINASGVLTPRKAGTTKITVTAGKKKKSTLKVTIRRNIVDNIFPKPTKAVFDEIGDDWDFVPKSVERTADGMYVCKFYLANGLGKSKRITDLGLQLYVGETLVAQKYLSKIKVVCDKGKSKIFKITFSGADLVVTDPLLLPQYGAENIRFELTTEPDLVYKQPKAKKTHKTTQTTGSESGTYILNNNSMKFHYSNCPSVSRMSPSNRVPYSGSRDELIAQGYDPCNNCNP